VVVVEPGAVATEIFAKGETAASALAQAPPERLALYQPALAAFDQATASQQPSPVQVTVTVLVQALEARRPRARYLAAVTPAPWRPCPGCRYEPATGSWPASWAWTTGPRRHRPARPSPPGGRREFGRAALGSRRPAAGPVRAADRGRGRRDQRPGPCRGPAARRPWAPGAGRRPAATSSPPWTSATWSPNTTMTRASLLLRLSIDDCCWAGQEVGGGWVLNGIYLGGSTAAAAPALQSGSRVPSRAYGGGRRWSRRRPPATARP
jgi:hypothetical protein